MGTVQFLYQCFIDVNDKSDEAEGSDEDLYTDLYCVACNKTFTNDKAFANHERSKKHKKNIAILREQMKQDDSAENDDGSNEDIREDVPEEDDEVDLEDILEEDHETYQDLLEDTSDKPKSKLSKKQKKRRRQQQQLDDMYDEILEETTESETAKRDDTTEGDNDDVSDLSERFSKDAKLSQDTEAENKADGKNLSQEEVTEIKSSKSKSKKGKDKGPGGKTNTQLQSMHGSQGGSSDQSSTVCNVCKGEFQSRNKLFDHIKKTGHAVRVEPGSSRILTNETKSKKKGKKR
ncbi:dnaJ homolog subfamily C member 21-like [Ptychodera flava]|uniref:dnaJ homolog subfamily C member 21-like n=1 Tax=Ptychodera flava TaxID=63121 RepID=UPI00396A9F47